MGDNALFAEHVTANVDANGCDIGVEVQFQTDRALEVLFVKIKQVAVVEACETFGYEIEAINEVDCFEGPLLGGS